MTKTFLDLQDLRFNFDDLTVLEDDKLFKFEPIAARSYAAENYGVMDISIEMNLDQTYQIRECYDMLNLLSDVGGLQTIMIIISSLFISVFNYENFDTFLASRLFKIKFESETDADGKNIFEQSDYFRGSKWSNFKLYLMNCLPRRAVCCKRSYQERGIKIAIEAMHKEIDIIEIIKTRRYFGMALRKLLTSKQRMKLKEKSRYHCVDPKTSE